MEKKNEVTTTTALAMLMMLVALGLAITWMVGVDRAGIPALAAFSGGIITLVTGYFTTKN